MNLCLDNASTTRKRNYDVLAMVNLLNETNTMNEVDFNITKSDSDDKYTEILLQNLLCQFEADAPAKIQVSQRQMRAQRATTAKILKVVQKILLTSTIESDAMFDEYVLCGCKELRMALEILIDRWGLGDIQICSSLVKTLLQSYLPTPTLTGKRIFQQKFILLDLLPFAAAGDSDNCRYLQSVIANALMQVLPKCGKNCSMYEPIICWCEWYLNHHQYYKLHSTLRNESSSNNFVTVSFVMPEDIYKLGLQLLRSVPSTDLLPRALSVNLDFFAVTSKTDFNTTSWLKQHTKELIATLRQRWTELILPRNLTSRSLDAASERDESAILDCQLQLLNLFENAVLDKDIKQECLLIDTYVKLLQVTSRNTREISELQFSYGPPKRITKRKPNSGSTHVDSLNVDVETNVFTIDWIFVMMLLSSKKYKTTAINIVDTWCIREAFDSLSQAIDIMFMNQCTHKSKITEFAAPLPIKTLDTRKRKHTLHRLVPCLLRMTSVLLLKPQRDYLSYYGIPSAGTLMQFESDSSTNSLTLESRSILAFFVHFDYHRQKELINMLLHVTDECLFYSGVKISERSLADINFKFDDINQPSYMQRAVSIVVQKVFTILQHITQSNPLSMHLKRKLMERLSFPVFNEAASLLHANVDREICKLLVSLMRQSSNDEILGMENDCTRSDVLMLLHKLLFSESCRSSTTHSIRGMILATELLSTNHWCIISIEERKSIQEWVLRRLLPCTRRMIEPEVGLTGLSILNGWIDADPNEKLSSTKSSFFRHIKMMVANTGLVQVLNNYRRAGILKESKLSVLSKVILAYCAHATQSKPTCTDQETQREIFLGLNFFLRRTKEIIVNPSRWSPTADWVYALIDTYLQMGRSRLSKGWNPLNWLRASMEFPTIDISFFNPSNEAQRLIVEFIDKNLCQFELSKGIQDNTCFPGSYADVVVSRLFSKKLKAFIDSLSYFAAALLIGISISSAVLKNAYEHAQSTNSMSREFKKFMTLQIIKIYDLRAKSTTVDSLFLSINSALRRSLIRKKRATVVLSDDSSDDGTCSVVPSSRGNQVSGFILIHYCSRF
jgi:hypothetical protein